ncbi:DMT family transporter [Marinoscillum sp. 108]|jgi:drug/metabolite transporter (DMT)-like permease|uniref:DMT family transporter n=1 Tax=Marinoscillum sp. 108 TaxID=2653151 RepID=UPI0012F2A6EC|nr:DMT family transporter [Marinoscillum sp. 108]VXD19814.1 EamA domain-containing membrane protein RarD [Marinoscillum sp. 108]
MNQQLAHLLQLGLAIFIMSSSGTLGRYIELPPPVTIWMRCIIGAVALFIVLKVGKFDLRIGNRKNFWLLFGSSLLLAGHWVSYFYSLKLSTVAIGMLSLFTYPVITAFLEPVMLKIPFQKSSLALGILAFVGVALLAPELSFENEHTLGIAIGVFSALCYSIRNILMKKRVAQQSGITLMFYQLLFISLFLWPVLFGFEFEPAQLSTDWEALLILGLFTTATGHTLLVLSFKHFTVSTVSVISALTPLLGILLGFLVLNEIPAGRTYIGGSLIFLTVVTESLKSIFQKRN